LNAGDTTRVFTLLEATQTGIDFNNEVVDGESFNVLTYRNFYNGGGVAIGDINNDSLPDLYFTANQKKNKLYLNRGNLVFEDITEKAGVGGSMARFGLYKNLLYIVNQNSLLSFKLNSASDATLLKTTYLGWNVETIFISVQNTLLLVPMHYRRSLRQGLLA
jgi:hypothetical protein